MRKTAASERSTVSPSIITAITAKGVEPPEKSTCENALYFRQPSQCRVIDTPMTSPCASISRRQRMLTMAFTSFFSFEPKSLLYRRKDLNFFLSQIVFNCIINREIYLVISRSTNLPIKIHKLISLIFSILLFYYPGISICTIYTIANIAHTFYSLPINILLLDFLRKLSSLFVFFLPHNAFYYFTIAMS